ncbi:MAG TPA: DNA primase [Actinomycetota bacterium]|nr:DNA primase [Actinomycetota bacterium]
MSPRYARDDIDEVLERANIVEVVGEHVRLRRAGRELVGLCPFHQEKTGSFNVNPEKGVYHCHGCGAGGGVFSFVQEVEGLSFTEAVEHLANRYGVQLREVSGTRKVESPRARLVSLHEAAVEHYRGLLAHKEGGTVRAYLDDRGIGPDLRERHRIGFGGWTRDGLVRALTRRNFTTEELVTAGLAAKEGRAVRDVFHGRLLFPIYDPSERPVGFGGRVLPENYRSRPAPDAPKYLNSRETPLFKKSRVLYGANWARGDIVRTRRMVLVEGYTDVIAMHAAGVREAVATCGTSLTEQHMQEISRRFGDVRIVLCLDGDAAGQAAASRERTEELAEAYSPGGRVTGGKWLPLGKGWLPEVYVALLPAGKDPADFVRESGAEAVEAVLSAASPLVRFLLARALDGERLDTPESRTRAVRRGAGVLAQVGDSLLRHEYSVWLADRCHVDVSEVVRAVEDQAGRASSARRQVSRDAGPAAPVVLTGAQRIEREALRCLVAEQDLLDDSDVCPQEDEFTLPLHRSLLRLLVHERTEHGTIDPARLAARMQDDDLRRAAAELAVGASPGRVTAEETLLRLRALALARNIEDKKVRLRALDPEREARAYDSLFEELLTLESKRRALGTGARMTSRP